MKDEHFSSLSKLVLRGNSTRFLCLMISLLILFLSACSNPAIIPEPTVVLPTETEQQPTPSPLPTKTEATFWLDPSLPQDMAPEFRVPAGARLTEDYYQANVLLQSGSIPQDKQVLASSSYVYALVAPFLTVQDEISLADLQSLARGDFSAATEGPVRLFVRASDLDSSLSLPALMRDGMPVGIGLQVVPNQILPEDITAHDWALVPFQMLLPQWKVIRVDGQSPLDADFDAAAYGLSLPYALLTDSSTQASFSAEQLDEIRAALPVSNRDESSLTSLIMTGVTAMARDTAYTMETQGVLRPATYIGELLRSANLTHISNEVSFYKDCPYPNPDDEGFSFCSNPAYIDLLSEVGADVIELSGNHNNDVRALYQVNSVPFTLELYKSHGMRTYGGGNDLQEARAPLLIEDHGNRLAFIACNSYGPEMAWATETSSGAAPCGNFIWLQDEVVRLRQEGYLPIVTFQYQEDYFVGASSAALQDFRAVAKAGAVIVNGSQSHVAKPMEFYEGSFVHYGLGNLFFDQTDYLITYNSFIQEHYFYKGQHISTLLYTITLEETALPRFMTLAERQVFLERIFDAGQALEEIR